MDLLVGSVMMILGSGCMKQFPDFDRDEFLISVEQAIFRSDRKTSKTHIRRDFRSVEVLSRNLWTPWSTLVLSQRALNIRSS